MQRGVSQLLAVLLTLCSAVALLHVSIALGATRQFGDSPRTTQTIRSYYASVNSYLAGGDEQDVPLSIVGSSGGLDMGDAALILGAIRATYPNLHLEPGEVSGAGDLALSQVTAVDGEANLPPWINDGIGQPYPNSVDSLRIENGQVVERLSSARIGVLAHTMAGAEVDFRLDRPSSLKIAELVLSDPDSKGKFVSVSGPGFVLPVDGAFTVQGNGFLQVSNSPNGTKKLIPSGQQTVITGEEILVIPHGTAVLRPADHSRVRLMLLAMAPMQPEPRYAERHGPETLEAVLNRLTVDDARERIWFGSIQVLAVAPNELQPGWLSMDLTRILVPAGEAVRLSPLDHQLVALVRTDDAWVEFESFEMTNASDSMLILDAARACWRGVEFSPHRLCAAQSVESG